MLMRPLLGLKPGTRPSCRAAGRIRFGVEDGNETAYETLLRSSRQNQIWGMSNVLLLIDALFPAGWGSTTSSIASSSSTMDFFVARTMTSAPYSISQTRQHE
nr:hypothetical protein Iba_chr05aCG15960 [Ipomoea batatas]